MTSLWPATGPLTSRDFFAGQILRLKPGAKEFEVWASDPRWAVPGKAQLDGIAILPDGAIYANIFEGDGLYRIAVNADGSAGQDHQACRPRARSTTPTGCGRSGPTS